MSSGQISYVIGLDSKNQLRHLYLGPSNEMEYEESPRYNEEASLGDVDSYEYPVRGPMLFQETILAAYFSAADRDLQLDYVDHDINLGNVYTLKLQLRDRYHPLAVDLQYEVADDLGVFRRWAVIRNEGKAPFVLEEAGSFAFYQSTGQRMLHHLAGTWGDEMNPIAEKLQAGRKVLESRRGYTGHVNQPWFALVEKNKDRTIFGALEWSGNWKFSFDCDVAGRLSVTGGMSNFDFNHTIPPGSSFTTPVAVLGAVQGNLDDAARSLHDYVRSFVLPHRVGQKDLPVVFESWLPTFGRELSSEKLINHARRAAEIGVELFIITAGWYSAEHPVSHEGDWNASTALYPNGLEEVADEVRKLGMKLGLWMEPEAVAENSKIFLEHQDWVYQFSPPGPQPRGDGNFRRLILNLSREDVYEHVKREIFRLIRQYKLDYFRTDLNCPLSSVGDPSGLSGSDRDLVWRHVMNYYRLLDEIRLEFPKLIIENCAGGGGRLDYGVLSRTDTAWISDNVDPLYRLAMFMAGTSYLPAIVFESWVCEWPERTPFSWHPGQTSVNRPKLDMDFHFRVCMMGHLGISSEISEWTEEGKARAKHHVAKYKELREIMRTGTLYRLTEPAPRDGSGEWAALVFVAQNKQRAIAFVYRLASASKRFQLRIPGLQKDVVYELHDDEHGKLIKASGREISELGVELTVPSNFSSTLLIATPSRT